ncbi:MAG: hypothetical protein VKQ33_06515 [Candidatus Sericytochromatia bacterium]|nr:hypothetical protein [Candidatus Sericytochromatia bacterium]
MTMINNNGTGLGLNGLSKRLSGNEGPKEATKEATRGAFQSDALVRSSTVSGAAPTAAAAAAASLERLSSAYHPDPAVFARNLAEQALGEVVALVG